MALTSSCFVILTKNVFSRQIRNNNDKTVFFCLPTLYGPFISLSLTLHIFFSKYYQLYHIWIKQIFIPCTPLVCHDITHPYYMDGGSYRSMIHPYIFAHMSLKKKRILLVNKKNCCSATWLEKHPFNTCSVSHLPALQRSFIQVLAFIATHTFGLRLIYPGSLSLIQNLFCKY